MIFQEILQWPRVRQSPPERQSTTNTTHGLQLSFWPWLHTHPTRRCHREDLSLVQVSSSESWLVTAGTWCSGSTSEPRIKHFQKGLYLFSAAEVAQRTTSSSPCAWRCHSRSAGPWVLAACSRQSPAGIPAPPAPCRGRMGSLGPTGVTLTFSSSQLR